VKVYEVEPLNTGSMVVERPNMVPAIGTTRGSEVQHVMTLRTKTMHQ